MRNKKRSHPTFGAPTASRSEGNGGGNAGREQTNLGSLPIVESEPEGNKFLESNVLEEDCATKSGGREPGKRMVSRYTFAPVVVGGRYWRGLGGIDINGEWI